MFCVPHILEDWSAHKVELCQSWSGKVSQMYLVVKQKQWCWTGMCRYSRSRLHPNAAACRVIIREKEQPLHLLVSQGMPVLNREGKGSVMHLLTCFWFLGLTAVSWLACDTDSCRLKTQEPELRSIKIHNLIFLLLFFLSFLLVVQEKLLLGELLVGIRNSSPPKRCQVLLEPYRGHPRGQPKTEMSLDLVSWYPSLKTLVPPVWGVASRELHQNFMKW